jgi:hypothetical protein
MLLNWWPAIAKTIRTAKPGTIWAVPLTWKENGKLKRIPITSRSITKANPEKTKTATTKNMSRKKKPASATKNKRQGILDL